ncbi:MAG TPA: ribosome small subunit-dependent GTPase A [Rudaea sp.]|nr:ribosome small subunit-dependent GTPase A [Rudaea sp.]
MPEGTVGLRLLRVVAQHRNGYRVHDGATEFPAQPAPRFLRRGGDPVERPAVGDFVLVEPTSPLLIRDVLPRRSELSRAAAGERYQRQVIATNIDSVIVLMGLDGDFNPRRIERYLALIQGSGAQPVIVLTKRDKVDDDTFSAASASVRELLPAQVELHAINAKDSASIAPLLGHLQHGDTAVLVGSSGAGKSTLTNTLLGVQRQATNTVRDNDSRGRHTTTHRALIALPSGGCLIDTPGMRELKLTGDEELGQAGFADIETLALQCRFGDCAHGNEPGCAVRAALDSGALDAARWANFLKMRDELSATNETLEAQLRRKGQARVANKALNKRLNEKYGGR